MKAVFVYSSTQEGGQAMWYFKIMLNWSAVFVKASSPEVAADKLKDVRGGNVSGGYKKIEEAERAAEDTLCAIDYAMSSH